VSFYPRWGLEDVPNAGTWTEKEVEVRTKVRWRR